MCNIWYNRFYIWKWTCCVQKIYACLPNIIITITTQSKKKNMKKVTSPFKIAA